MNAKTLLKRFIPDSGLLRLRALDYRMRCGMERALLARLCDKQKCSIDAGANLGVLTYFLARYSSHVYAYEPNPELAAKLRRACGNNVTVAEAALSDQPGTAVLRIPSYDGQEFDGLASISQGFADADGVRRFDVPMRRLDDEGLKNVGFVKIDVEQHEEQVLRGAMNLFREQRPNILLEVTPKLYSTSLTEFLADVLNLGYDGYFIYGDELIGLDDYRMDIHNRSENYGASGKYVTNVVLSNKPLMG